MGYIQKGKGKVFNWLSSVALDGFWRSRRARRKLFLFLYFVKSLARIFAGEALALFYFFRDFITSGRIGHKIVESSMDF